MNKNYYKILGVSQEADKSEIKKAYFAKAKMYHPDVCKDKDAEEKFKEVSTAYEILSDETSRKNYDDHLKSGSNNNSGNYQSNSGSSEIDYSILHQMFTSSSTSDIYFFDGIKNNFKTEQEVASAYAYF
jgi:molecular chaperone DnaJ